MLTFSNLKTGSMACNRGKRHKETKRERERERVR
jgi:hypothetical protein